MPFFCPFSSLSSLVHSLPCEGALSVFIAPRDNYQQSRFASFNSIVFSLHNRHHALVAVAVLQGANEVVRPGRNVLRRTNVHVVRLERDRVRTEVDRHCDRASGHKPRAFDRRHRVAAWLRCVWAVEAGTAVQDVSAIVLRVSSVDFVRRDDPKCDTAVVVVDTKCALVYAYVLLSP